GRILLPLCAAYCIIIAWPYGFVKTVFLIFSGFFQVFSLSFRYDLNPVSVRICNEVDSHRRILKGDTPHFLMASVQFIISVCYKGKMEFTFSKVVWLCPIFQP